MNSESPQLNINAHSFSIRQLLILVAFMAVWMALFSWNRYIGIATGVSVVPAVVSVALLRFIRGRDRTARSTLKTGLLIFTLSLAWFSLYFLSFGPFLAYWDTLPVLESQKKDQSVMWEFYLPADEFAYRTSSQWYLNLWSEPGIETGCGP